MSIAPTGDTPGSYALALLDLAAELAATVRDYSTDDTARVLARVPHGRHADLCVVLAAMVDPDARAADLVSWVLRPPPTRERFTPRHLEVREVARNRLTIAEERRAAVARLCNAGRTRQEIADVLDIDLRSVDRIRARLRAEQDEGQAA